MTNNNQPKKNRLKPIRNFIVKHKTYFLLAVAVPAIYCFLIIFFTKCFGMEVTEVASVVNGLFGAVSIIAVFITIRIQSQEMRDNREQLTRTANAQEGSNKFFQEQLRLSVLPFISCYINYREDPYDESLSSSLFIENKGKDCFNLTISILYENSNTDRTFTDYEQSILTNGELLMFRLNKKSPRYFIKLEYFDSLRNQYVVVIQNHPLKVLDFDKNLALIQTPNIPNPDMNLHAETIWKSILNEATYVYSKTLVTHVTKTRRSK